MFLSEYNMKSKALNKKAKGLSAFVRKNKLSPLLSGLCKGTIAIKYRILASNELPEEVEHLLQMESKHKIDSTEYLHNKRWELFEKKKEWVEGLCRVKKLITEFEKVFRDNKSSLPDIGSHLAWSTTYQSNTNFNVYLYCNFTLKGYVYKDSVARKLIGNSKVKLCWHIKRDLSIYTDIYLKKQNLNVPINPHVYAGDGGIPCLGGFQGDITNSLLERDYFTTLYLLSKFYKSIDPTDEWGRYIYRDKFISVLTFKGRQVVSAEVVASTSPSLLASCGLGIIPRESFFIFNHTVYLDSEYVKEYITGKPLLMSDKLYRVPLFLSKETLRGIATTNEGKLVLDSFPNEEQKNDILTLYRRERAKELTSPTDHVGGEYSHTIKLS